MQVIKKSTILYANMTNQENRKNKSINTQRCKNRAAVFKALAHPTRILIVDALAQREHCVSELVELVGDDPSTISKHLSIMKSAGIVNNDRRGSSVFYCLKMQCVPGFMHCVDNAIISSARNQLDSNK